MKKRISSFLAKQQNKKAIALAAAVVVAGAGILLLKTHASGFFAAADPESGQTSGNVAVVSDSSAAGGRAVQFGVAPGGSAGSGGTLNLPRIAWNGGPAYYSAFPNSSGMTDPNYFPIGVWYEGTYEQGDIDTDKGAGLNTYVELTGGSNMPLIRQNGMHAITSTQISGYGSETNGWLLTDEADMWAGPGSDKWTGKYPGEGDICSPTNGKCGYSVLSKIKAGQPQDGRMSYANLGKGVMFWDSDSEAATFVNNYTNIVSNDIYWYTDNNVCENAEGPTLIPGSGPVSQYTGLKNLTNAECRRAANYGVALDRMRELDAKDGKLQAIWGFVEDGHPGSENPGLTITGPQLQGAVMSSLIHEARGIIYFNHNFGGSCQSQHVLRDCGVNTIRPYATTMDSHISSLAPVLNTQSYQWNFNGTLDTMLKEYGGSYYVFAMPSIRGGTGNQTFTLPSGMKASKIEAMFENRTITPNGSSFSDSFANEYSYHIYKITP